MRALKERTRRWAKYPCCFGRLTLVGLVTAARDQGMLCIQALKPDMHVYNEIGLFGTSSQMRATEDIWRSNGHELKPRKFTAFAEVDLGRPRADWAEWELKAC